MQTYNPDQGSRSKDLEWYLLEEFSLGDFSPAPERGGKITAELLSHTAGDLDKPAECVDHSEMTLKSLVREALVYFRPGREELPARIRVFCQQKVINEEIKGGWGYFVIERSRDVSTCEGNDSHHFDNLYDGVYFINRERIITYCSFAKTGD